MFTIIQSHRTEQLVTHLLESYQSQSHGVFEPFVVIVPSMVLGDWLDKSIASRAGISTLVTTKFWGQYQWSLMQSVLTCHNQWLIDQDPEAQVLNVPEVAVLSTTVMQWRLFGYLTYYCQSILNDESHPVFSLLSTLLGDDEDQAHQDARLWQLAADLARVFNRYLTHRDDWLRLWSDDQPLDIEGMIDEKDQLSQRFDQFAAPTPEWLYSHYSELEAAQRYLWVQLFTGVYQHRVAIEQLFWQALANNLADERSQLPKALRIFTIQQLPQNELDFLQRLSKFVDITLLHYNPSKLFWADIVDKDWLQRQQIINPKNVFLRDYGHALLSRLGKQSRETFAMLAGLSGNELYDDIVVDWQDQFVVEPVDEASSSLLSRLQNDVLMLDEAATQQATATYVSQALGDQLQLNFDESEPSQSDQSSASLAWYSDSALENKHYIKQREWSLSGQDNSLSIHSCHSLQRQLEVLRGMIGRWLNEPNPDGSSRHVSDIVVLLPDVDRHHALINSVFVDGRGQDGLILPAKVTGVVDTSIRQLWEAIIGFYRLLGSDNARFEAPEVLDWLKLAPLYESFGLTHEQMSRGCELLTQAGFVRGFDEQHLQQQLDLRDYDYRFSFAHALDRLTLGLVMPQACASSCLYPVTWPEDMLPEMSLPLESISLADAPIIEALCRIYQGLAERRDDYTLRLQAEDWLKRIESQVIHPYFGAVDQTRSMRAIYNAMNGFKSSLRANRHYRQFAPTASSATASLNPSGGIKADSNEHIEQRLSSVDTLPLKLSFMLDSIEDELESQQVSAEPTGVITFGRFGALRNVPFGLVVMLNMNLSEFPNRDRDNRYDLMKAGLARRGDRFSEDDDNGAFLDALLCARSACWIFYNGQSFSDTHEHLPANPVSELMQFLQGEVQWQWQEAADINASLDTDEQLVGQLKRYLPRLVEQWLVTDHPALPFSREVFEVDSEVYDAEDQDLSDDASWRQMLQTAMKRSKLEQRLSYPPAEVWQAVFRQLMSQRQNERDLDYENKDAQVVKLPTRQQYQFIATIIGGDKLAISSNWTDQLADLLDIKGAGQLRQRLFAIDQIDLQSLVYQVRHPAKWFLREQQVNIIATKEVKPRQEPLSLTALSAYQINDQLLSQMTGSVNQLVAPDGYEHHGLPEIFYQDIMPAGVARQTTLSHQTAKIQQQCDDFKAQLQALNIQILDHLHADHSGSQLLTPTQEISTEVIIDELASSDSAFFQTFKAQLPARIQFKGAIPWGGRQDPQALTVMHCDPTASDPPTLWLNVLPSSASPRHLLRFWLLHLYWQVARRTTADQVARDEGRSIWRFNKSDGKVAKFAKTRTFQLAPITYQKAALELIKWAIFGQLSGQLPMTILPAYALRYIEKITINKNTSTSQADDDQDYYPKRTDFSEWLMPVFGSDLIYDTCAQHPIWQYLLQDQDPFGALTAALTTLAEPLYLPMFEALTTVQE